MNRSTLKRRDFLWGAAASLAGLALPACSGEPEPGRYTEADIARLIQQRKDEAARSGRGPFGPQRYRGYRGLAELPWFELDSNGRLVCVADDFAPAIDIHCHLGMSMFLAPDLDLSVRTDRVKHLLDCDAEQPGCELDLDVYINANFTDEELGALQTGTVAQLLWGSERAATQTIPNLVAEMDESRVGRALILPIAFGLPIGDDLSERWMAAIRDTGSQDRLIAGGSVHPRDDDRVAKLEQQVAQGVRAIKLHPTVQRFYPDDPDMMELYEACDRLGVVVLFHAGRAGIEPEATHRYALPRHFDAVLSTFPNLNVVMLHSGARDANEALPLALRYENAWLGIHGQGVTTLSEMLAATGGERMLFGTDWPFYHLSATLAKVLMITEGSPEQREAILHGNAERLMGWTA